MAPSNTPGARWAVARGAGLLKRPWLANSVKRAATLTLAKLVSAGLGGTAALVIAAVLGPSRTGTYALLVTLATLAAALGHLSVDRAEMVQWAEVRLRPSLAANSAPLGLVAGLVAAAATFVLVLLLGRSVVPVTPAMLALAMTGVPFMVATRSVQATLFLAEQPAAVSVSLVVSNGAAALAIFTLAVTGHLSVMAAMFAWVGDQACGFAVLALLGKLGWRHLSPAVARRSVRIGLGYHLGSLSTTSLLSIDVAILSAMVPTADVGRYAVAAYLAIVPWMVTDSISQVALPRLVGEGDAAARATSQVVAVTALVIVALCLGGGLLALGLVPALLGAHYAHAVAPLELLLPGTIALGVSDPIRLNLLRQGRPAMLSAVLATGAVVNIALDLVLIPALSDDGAAISSTVAYTVVALGVGTWFHRTKTARTALPPGSEPARALPG